MSLYRDSDQEPTFGLEPLEQRLLLSVSQSVDGWTVVGASGDTQVIYVSSSQGNDSNSGLSEGAAVKTLAHAKTLVRDGKPDWLLLRRGDEWFEPFGNWDKSGRSPDEPLLISSYGTATARPMIKTGTSDAFNTKSSNTVSNVAIIGLHFYAHTRDPSGGSTTNIDFNNFSVLSYGNQDNVGTFNVLDGGATLQVQDNSWKRINLPYNVTSDTVIEFDFRSNDEAEIHGIGFDENNTHGDAVRNFQLFGTQTATAIQDFNNYDGNLGQWVHYSIPVGQYYQGSMQNLFFVGDNDVNPLDGDGSFRNVKIVDAGPAQTNFNVGLRWRANGDNLLIEDTRIQSYGWNMDFNAGEEFTNFTMRRSQILDAYAINSHSHGLYIEDFNGIVLEENVFDHNGWHEQIAGAEQDIFSRNVYVQVSNSDVTVRNNVYARGSSEGIQVRPGGLVDNNLLIANPIGMTFGFVAGGVSPAPNGVVGSVVNNVFMYGMDINGSNPRGQGLNIGNIAHGILANNLFVNDNSAQAFGNAVKFSADNGVGINNLSVTGNVDYDWRGGFEFRDGPYTDLVISNNLLQQPDDESELVDIFEAVTLEEMTFDTNTYFSNRRADLQFRIDGQFMEYADFVAATGETGSFQQLAFPDPTRSAENYSGLNGGSATLAGFLDLLRENDKATWDSDLTAPAFNNYMRTGFAVGTVVPPSTAFQFMYGRAIDFLGTPLQSYADQDGEGAGNVLDGGRVLQLAGDTWKRIDLPYRVTANTVLEFEFRSTDRSVLSGIGFDENDVLDDLRLFTLYSGLEGDTDHDGDVDITDFNTLSSHFDPGGISSNEWEDGDFDGDGDVDISDFNTQAAHFAPAAQLPPTAIEDFNHYDPSHGEWLQYSIPVGDFYTGDMAYLVFANDNEAFPGTGIGEFRNVVIREERIDFNSFPVQPYSDQDDVGTYTVTGGGHNLNLEDNTWKRIDLPYFVTEDTVLEFDFRSFSEAEIHGIGLDEDNDHTNDLRNFQLYGTQSASAIQDFNDYGSSPGQWVNYKIRVGDYYTGEMEYLFFVNDNDGDPLNSDGGFRDVKIYEAPEITNFTGGFFQPYSDQDSFGSATVSPDGSTVSFDNETWKRIDFDYEITTKTILEFEFFSTVEGEIHGIGLDEDNDHANDLRMFQLFGTEVASAYQGFNDYNGHEGMWRRYRIHIGEFYTGQMNYLFFANDNDFDPFGVSGSFRDVQVFEEVDV